MTLALPHAGGQGQFTATLHKWIDAAAMASQVPPAARRAGFGASACLWTPSANALLPST
jgi:hypothetical protein